MLEMYRRGQLEPDYPQGTQSMIREKMILESLHREEMGDFSLMVGFAQIMTYAPHIDRSKLSDFYAESVKSIKRGFLHKHHYADAEIAAIISPTRVATAVDENLVMLYNALMTSGLPELLEKETKQGSKRKN